MDIPTIRLTWIDTGGYLEAMTVTSQARETDDGRTLISGPRTVSSEPAARDVLDLQDLAQEPNVGAVVADEVADADGPVRGAPFDRPSAEGLLDDLLDATRGLGLLLVTDHTYGLDRIDEVVTVAGGRVVDRTLPGS